MFGHNGDPFLQQQVAHKMNIRRVLLKQFHLIHYLPSNSGYPDASVMATFGLLIILIGLPSSEVEIVICVKIIMWQICMYFGRFSCWKVF